MTEWSAYLQQVLDLRGMKGAHLSKALNLNERTTVSRWLRGKNGASTDMAVRVAVALGRPPLEALVAAGHVTMEASQLTYLPADAAQFSDAELLMALERRLAELRRAVPMPTPPQLADPEDAAEASWTRDEEASRDDYSLARSYHDDEDDAPASAATVLSLGKPRPTRTTKK